MMTFRDRIATILDAVNEGTELDPESSVYEIDDELVDDMIQLLSEIAVWADGHTGAGPEWEKREYSDG